MDLQHDGLTAFDRSPFLAVCQGTCHDLHGAPRSFSEGAAPMVNEHEYVDGTAIFTRDGDAAREFARRVRVGTAGINVPIPIAYDVAKRQPDAAPAPPGCLSKPMILPFADL
jgi:hypothetical protein